LEWERGGKDTTWTVHKHPTPESKVRYLSQSFVENLCSHDQHEKLVTQIEDILFQYVPKTQKMGTSDFSSLKDLKTRAVQREISKAQSNIRTLNSEIAALDDEIGKKVTVTENIVKLQKEKVALEAQKPPAATPAAQKEQEELLKLREKKAQFEKAIEAKRIVVGELDELRARARLLKVDVEEFNSAALAKLEGWGLSDKTASLVISVPADLAIVINDRIAALEKEIKAVEGNPEAVDANPETVAAVEKQILAIEAKSQLEAQQKLKLAAFGRRIAELTANIESSQRVLVAIDTTKTSERNEKRVKRAGEFKLFFEKLEEKKQQLEELYRPLNEPVAGAAERAKVEFYARFNFDVKRFIADGMALFDGRKMLVRSDSKLAEHAEHMWAQIKQAMPAVTVEPLRELNNVLIGGDIQTRSIADQLASEYSMRDFYNWLFNTECYDVEYGIREHVCEILEGGDEAFQRRESKYAFPGV
jgi:hypothetical protein